jgi:DNA polymerase III epsilon subunit-like protein
MRHDHNTTPPESYIVVDVEASGPSPGTHSMLSVGACTLPEPRYTFYVELQPDSSEFDAKAMGVHQLSLDLLAEEGTPPDEAMQQFADWVKQVIEPGAHPVFVAFNAPFDWMFVNTYFHRYLGHNPFGHKALDIKAYFMGLHGVPWLETSHRIILRHYANHSELTHHALRDALAEADLFQAMLTEARLKRLEEES